MILKAVQTWNSWYLVYRSFWQVVLDLRRSLQVGSQSTSGTKFVVAVLTVASEVANAAYYLAPAAIAVYFCARILKNKHASMVPRKWLRFVEESVPSWTIFVCCWEVNGLRNLHWLSFQMVILLLKLLDAFFKSFNKWDQSGITCMSWNFRTSQIGFAKGAFQLDGFALRVPVGLQSRHRFELNALFWTTFDLTLEY